MGVDTGSGWGGRGGSQTWWEGIWRGHVHALYLGGSALSHCALDGLTAIF